MMFIGPLLFILATSTVVYYYYLNVEPIQQGLSIGDWIERQKHTSFQLMLNNINPAGTKRGFFAASLSTENPDYFYTWTRDAALVARVLASLPDTDTSLLTDYVAFQIDTQTQPTLCECLGEPKFNADGTAYMGSWGRPQNDGPAERAIAFLLIATTRIQNNNYVRNTLLPAILRDVDYVVEVWQTPCFDLWEEVDGSHFYTLMVMRRALLDTLDFLDSLGLPRPDRYLQTVLALETKINTFWSHRQNYIIATQNIQNGVHKPSGLDVSTLIAANMAAFRNDGFFTPGSDKVLATAFHLEQVFRSLYPINQNQLDEDLLGTSIGRYPEDVYDGYGTSRGNPWFIATAAFTELYYLAIQEWREKGLVINDINRPFFNRIMSSRRRQIISYAPGSVELEEIIDKTSRLADRFLATVQYHQDRNGSMSEQFDRYIGYMAGARDLTWSHAAVLTAIKAREGTLLV